MKEKESRRAGRRFDPIGADAGQGEGDEERQCDSTPVRFSGDSWQETPLSPRTMAILVVGVLALAGTVVSLLLRGGTSPAERARRELDRPLNPLPTEEPPPLAAAGRLLYERHCMQCHGPRLQGGSAPALRARRYDRVRWSDQDIANVIYAGTGSMPAFGDVLSVGEIAAVVAYVRWEQGLPLPEVPREATESSPGTAQESPSDARPSS